MLKWHTPKQATAHFALHNKNGSRYFNCEFTSFKVKNKCSIEAKVSSFVTKQAYAINYFWVLPNVWSGKQQQHFDDEMTKRINSGDSFHLPLNRPGRPRGETDSSPLSSTSALDGGGWAPRPVIASISSIQSSLFYKMMTVKIRRCRTNSPIVLCWCETRHLNWGGERGGEVITYEYEKTKTQENMK